MRKTDQERIAHGNEIGAFPLGAFALAPFLVYYTFDGLSFLNLEWIARLLPKIDADFSKMTEIYGEAAASKFRAFFLTTVVVHFSIGIVMLLKLQFDIFRGQLLHIIFDPNWRNKPAEKWLVFTLWFIFSLVAWVLPSLIGAPDSWGPFTYQPGLRGQFLTTVPIGGSVGLTIGIITEFTVIWRKRYEANRS